MVAPVRILKPTPNQVPVQDPSAGVGVILTPEGSVVQVCTGCPEVTWKGPIKQLWNPPPGSEALESDEYYAPWWDAYPYYMITGSTLEIYPNRVHYGTCDFIASFNGVECPVVVRLNHYYTDYWGTPDNIDER